MQFSEGRIGAHLSMQVFNTTTALWRNGIDGFFGCRLDDDVNFFHATGISYLV